MTREGLQYGLRAAVQAARRTKRPSRRDDISVNPNFECPDLEAKIMAVLDSVTPQETGDGGSQELFRAQAA